MTTLTSFISNLLWEAFWMSLLIQEMKIMAKTSKSTQFSVQQMAAGEQQTKSVANQHQVHLQCIVGEIMDFTNLKTKTSD